MKHWRAQQDEKAGLVNYDFVKNFLRRRMRQPQIYALARRVMLVGQRVLHKPDEPDFVAFEALAKEKGLVVDIGANGGQSAVAFSFLLPLFDIISFEPNPALWRDLDFISRILGRRFSYRKIGLGPRADKMTLYVPQIDDLPITTRASLDRDAADAHCDRLTKEVGRRPEINETTVDIVPFDSLNLDPEIVKIDVEGFERHVLEGMAATLERVKPILLLERNEHDEACKAILSPLGYRFFYFDPVAKKLASDPSHRTRTWFAVPAHRVDALCPR